MPGSAPSGEFSGLLRGDFQSVPAWNYRTLSHYAAWIVIGSGLYGAAMGWWHSPLQAFYVAVKFPLIILLTAGGNALINGMLAPQLGLNMSFRESLAANLMSYTISSAILGAFAPIIWFMVWNAPAARSFTDYSLFLFLHVAAIAIAGIAGNARMLGALVKWGGSPAAANRVLWAWLATNLFLGSQCSWILRPFIGAPGLPVEFVRNNALKGNFYESLAHSFLHLLNKK